MIQQHGMIIKMKNQYSEYQINKARKIIRMNGVVEIAEDAYQVRSGTKLNDSYIVDSGVCTCPAMKFGRDCTHKLVVEMFKHG